MLVVDDEPMVREAMCQLLEHCGYEVEAAEGGQAALARLAQREFDLVITDFSMPGMPGDQLVIHIRERRPAQRVIMATGFVDEYKVFGQPAAHVDALLLKPFTFQELKDAIERVLAVEPPDKSDALPADLERPPEDDFRPPHGP
jgi:CheY-like chemotaxis protein